MSDPVYCYPPDHTVLKNKLGLRDVIELERAERRLVTQRISEIVPSGDFDLKHLQKFTTIFFKIFIPGPVKSAPSKSRKAHHSSSFADILKLVWRTCISVLSSKILYRGLTWTLSRRRLGRSWVMLILSTVSEPAIPFGHHLHEIRKTVEITTLVFF